MKGKGKGKGNGFSLLEVMIALAIIGITLAVVIHTVNVHANLMFENTLTTRMFQLAKEKIYEMETNPQGSRGNISSTDFQYENIVLETEDSDIVELKTVVRGHGKEVRLSELIVKKE